MDQALERLLYLIDKGEVWPDPPLMIRSFRSLRRFQPASPAVAAGAAAGDPLDRPRTAAGVGYQGPAPGERQDVLLC